MMKRRASTAAIAIIRQARPAPAMPRAPGTAIMLAAAVAIAAMTMVASSNVGSAPPGVRGIELGQRADIVASPQRYRARGAGPT
jgi:hypothetical protein